VTEGFKGIFGTASLQGTSSKLAEKSGYLNGTLLYMGIARKYLNG
jgi:hypothetical protein